MKLFGTTRKKRDGFCCLYIDHDNVAYVEAKRLADESQPLIVTRYEFLPDVLTETDDRERAKLFKSLVAKHDAALLPCYLVLSTEYYSLLSLELPDNLPDGEISAALPWLVKELIDYPVEQAVMDAFPMVTSAGQTRKVYAVIARTAPLQQLQQQLISAGFNLLGINITELALSGLLSPLTAEDESSAILMLYSDRYQIVVNQGKHLYFTRVIQDAAGTLMMKQQSSDADDISLEIQRSLDYSQAQMHQAVPVGLYLVPSLADEAALLTQLTKSLTTNVKPLDLSKLMTFQIEMDVVMRAHCLFALAEAVRIGVEQ